MTFCSIEPSLVQLLDLLCMNMNGSHRMDHIDIEDPFEGKKKINNSFIIYTLTPETPKVFCGLKHFTCPSIGVVLSRSSFFIERSL